MKPKIVYDEYSKSYKIQNHHPSNNSPLSSNANQDKLMPLQVYNAYQSVESRNQYGLQAALSEDVGRNNSHLPKIKTEKSRNQAIHNDY
jgi:hypothetical protein